MTDSVLREAEKLAAAVLMLPQDDMERVTRLLQLYAAAGAREQAHVRALLSGARETDGVQEIRARQELIIQYLRARTVGSAESS